MSDETEGLDNALPTGVVPLASAAIMENVHNVAGRIEAHVEKSSYRSSGFVPGQVETIDITNPTRLDQQLGFPAHSVIVDNPTTQWLFVQSAQRFAPPRLMGAIWQIPKASTTAQAQWRAPFGVTNPTLEEATQATLTFCEAFLMPSPGIILPAATADTADGIVIADVLPTIAALFGFNGTNFDRLRSASAANLIAQLGIGALESVPPGMWSVVSTPAAGAQATATRAAGAAGVRHVAWGIIVSFGAIAAPVATLLQWNLRDGATGAGTILASGQVAVPAAVLVSDFIDLASMNIPGTAATAMTLEFSGALANLAEGVTLLGYDVS